MIVITGGSCQGKLKFAENLLKETTNGHEGIANGDTDSYETMFRQPIIYGFQQYIRRMLEDQVDWELYVRRILLECQESLIIIDEVGCGIVPRDKSDRVYRDTVGVAGQQLAAGANQVYRVICGMGIRIK